MVKCKYCEKIYAMDKDRHACLYCENKYEILEQDGCTQISILWTKEQLIKLIFGRTSWFFTWMYKKLYTKAELIDRYSHMCVIRQKYKIERKRSEKKLVNKLTKKRGKHD